MIFDSKQYEGLCTCGREHQLVTKFCVVESGSLYRIKEYMDAYSLTGYTVAVYDENTYKATSDRHPEVDCEAILPTLDLHANEHGVELLMEKLPKESEILIAIGSGTVHDITRYCAYSKKIDFVSCPTAASVDGFCSSVAAMTWNGCKKTLTAVAPKIVVADLDVIKSAPIRLAKSGFGDMVGKYVALTDWSVGRVLKNEYYCEKIASITLEATKSSLSSLEGILRGEADAFETLIYGLLLSGLAMQMIGNSRPASGAEHHISHIIEMEPFGLGVHSDALHGEKVGVGTLLVLREYQKLLNKEHLTFSDYETFSDERISEIFGEKQADEIHKENETDTAAGITAEILQEKQEELMELISLLPRIEDLTSLFERSGVKSTLTDLGVSEEKKDLLLRCAPMVRNRLTLLRLISQNSIR